MGRHRQRHAAPPAFQYNPNFSYTDGSGTHSVGQAITFNDHDGIIGDAGNYNAAFVAVQAAQMAFAKYVVTNMAPFTFNAFDIQRPAGFNAVSVTFVNVRGGSIIDGQNGTWTYTPNSTLWVAPWDPFHPFGGGLGDGDDGGASFTVVFHDANGATAQSTIVLIAAHSGYLFFHYGQWVDGPGAMDPQGGIMLVGGGDHPQGAYQWFVRQAGYGDVVVIENNKSLATIRLDAIEFAKLGIARWMCLI